MFDVGWDELLLIAVVALIVIGPKDLPMAMRAVARLLNRARSLNREFQNSLQEVMREAELQDLRKKMEEAHSFDIARKVQETIDPTGRLTEDFDPQELAQRMRTTIEMGPPEKAEAETTPPAVGVTAAADRTGEETLPSPAKPPPT